jgi:hypothetical protein
MRLVNFSPLLYRWCQLAGLDRSVISSGTFTQFRDLVDGRLETIWKSEQWPDLQRVTDYPGTSVSTDANGIRTVTLTDDIAEVLSVYDQDPRVTTRARLLKYFLYTDTTGRYINMMEAADPIFVEWRITKPALFGDPYSATQAYSVGAQVYFDTSSNSGSYLPGPGKAPAGNFYNCTTLTTAGQSPVTTPSSWEMVEVPYFAGEYLVRGALSDYLRSEGQFDQAAIAEADAEAARQREVDRILREEGQINRPNVFTY